MRSEDRPYLSYLLRLWREGGATTWTWRATLEDAHTGTRQGFASLRLLFAFLEDLLGVTVQKAPLDPGPDISPQAGETVLQPPAQDECALRS